MFTCGLHQNNAVALQFPSLHNLTIHKKIHFRLKGNKPLGSILCFQPRRLLFPLRIHPPWQPGPRESTSSALCSHPRCVPPYYQHPEREAAFDLSLHWIISNNIYCILHCLTNKSHHLDLTNQIRKSRPYDNNCSVQYPSAGNKLFNPNWCTEHPTACQPDHSHRRGDLAWSQIHYGIRSWSPLLRDVKMCWSLNKSPTHPLLKWLFWISMWVNAHHNMFWHYGDNVCPVAVILFGLNHL